MYSIQVLHEEKNTIIRSHEVFFAIVIVIFRPGRFIVWKLHSNFFNETNNLFLLITVRVHDLV